MVPPWQQIRQRITLFPLADALVREWRAGALEKAIEALLCEVGRTGLTSDVIARRLGVVKGSVRLTRDAVDAAIGRSLDEWERQLLTPKTDVSDEPVIEDCRALFATARSGRGVRASFPCCLGESPCPNGWTERWGRIGPAFGFGANEVAQLLGEAIQAAASSEELQGLLVSGRGVEALTWVTELLGGNDPGSRLGI